MSASRYQRDLDALTVDIFRRLLQVARHVARQKTGGGIEEIARRAIRGIQKRRRTRLLEERRARALERRAGFQA